MSHDGGRVRPSGETIRAREDHQVTTNSDPGIPGRRLDAFEAERPRLMGLAYRILGSIADAEDVLQDAWLRWDTADPDTVESARGFLTTVVTRLSIDRLRRIRARREAYTGPWLPEPIVTVGESSDDPAAAAELADSLSMALLVVLETLSPLERAAFVLREVFERPYAEVAAALGKHEAATRQLVHRARDHVDAGHARFQADRSTHAAVVQRFLTACQNADLDALMEILAPDVVIVSDGGGLAPAPRRPVYGRDKVARLLVGIGTNVPPGTGFTLEYFNGSLGIVARIGDLPISAMAVEASSTMVTSLHLLANPEKLHGLGHAPPGIV
jgi:RNA polymerase sigma-70 factor (ECF subfamily)